MYKRGRLLGPSSGTPSRSRTSSPMSRSRSPSRASFGKRGVSSPAKKTLRIQTNNTPEQKNLGTDPVWTLAATVGTVTFLNGCAQGINTNQHVGRKIVITAIHCRAAVSCLPAAGTSAFARLLIVYDKETNNATPAATDILEVDAVNGWNNLVNGDRFTTVYDSGIQAGNIGGCATSPFAANFVFEAYRKNLGLPVTFSGTGATVASVETGGLFALTYVTAAGGTVPTGLLSNSNVRIRYTDA